MNGKLSTTINAVDEAMPGAGGARRLAALCFIGKTRRNLSWEGLIFQDAPPIGPSAA
jgi:hypothetical protein